MKGPIQRALVLAAAAAAVVAGSSVFTACDDGFIDDHPCSNIPAGGCPLSHGVACDDPACLAVYACVAGDVWQLDHTCPGNDGATGKPAEDDGGDAASSALDASFDAPPGAFGGPGCPDLETPDCTVGAALACEQASGNCCDCEDLYVCDDGGWTEWGSCSADAGIVPNE